MQHPNFTEPDGSSPSTADVGAEQRTMDARGARPPSAASWPGSVSSTVPPRSPVHTATPLAADAPTTTAAGRSVSAQAATSTATAADLAALLMTDAEAAAAKQSIAESIDMLRTIARHGEKTPREWARERLACFGIELTEGSATFPVTLLPATTLLDTSFPPLEFVCRPYIPRGEVIEIVGPHGSFKSTVALDLALAVATGRTWGGVPTVQGKSAFITLEDREAVIAHRVVAYLAGIDSDAERVTAERRVRENFSYLAREQARELALTQTDKSGTLVRVDNVERVAALVAGRDLVILETASRLHPGPETNEGLAAFAAAVEQIATTAGSACGVVRHTPKATARDTEKEPDSYWGRGGASFSDAARSVLNIRVDAPAEGEARDPLAPVRLTHSKPPPFSRRGDPLAWRPTPVDINDPDGPIFLRSVGFNEQVRDDAAIVLHQLRDFPDGFPKGFLKKGKSFNLPPARARAALEHLVSTGRATCHNEKRGKTNQGGAVFRASDFTS